MARTMSLRTRAVFPLVALLGLSPFAGEAWAAPGAFDLTSPTNGAWYTATCTFTWQSSSSAASYDLYVDSALKHAAVAATTYTLAAGEALADGWHTWSAVAKDSGGATTASTSTFSVRVDASPPTVPALLAPATDAWVGSASPTLSWSASTDTGSGLSGYELWLNGAAVATGIPAATTSAAVSLPTSTIFYTSFATSCPGSWQLSNGNWYCGYGNGTWHLNFPIGASGRQEGTATMPGAMDLSNAGHAYLTVYEQARGTTALFEMNASYDGGSSWQTIKLLAPSPLAQYSSDVIPLDDFTGTSSAKLDFYGSADPGEGWIIDWLSVKAVLGGSYAWQVVAVDTAGNRTPSETRQLRYDLPPARFALSAPTDGTWTTNTKPMLSWNGTSDAGSGLASYQLWIDDAMSADGISSSATSAAPVSALVDRMHKWRVYAIDAAGAVRKSNESWWIGVDTTPPATFSLLSPADQSASSIPTPTLCWNAATDGGSGVDHYQLFLDGALARDGVSATCTTPITALAEGAHTWSVKAVDKVGNARSSTETWTVYVDFNPPAAFYLVSPGASSDEYETVNTLTPTFTWQASASSGSGLDHYELYIAETGGNLACAECAIPPTSTSVAVTSPLSAGYYRWTVRAVDHLSGPTQASTHNQNGYGLFRVTCTGTCQSGPEPGPEQAPETRPEPAVEPSPDAGVDAPLEAGTDAATGTTTSTATSTATTTGTSTSTSTATSTATGTSVGAEPRPDGSLAGDLPSLGPDALSAGPDTLRSDTAPHADAILANVDVIAAPDLVNGGTTDAIADLLPQVDTPPSSGGSLDAAARDAVSSALDGAGRDGATTSANDSSGCGCAIGEAKNRTTWYAPILFLGFLLLSLRVHPRRRGSKAPPSR